MAKVDLGQVKGDKGDAFTFEDFTEAQLLSLKGDKGDKGADGITPTVQVGTVETLDAGSSATVTGTTSGTTLTLNFGIPQGETGDLSTVTNPTFNDSTSTYTTLDDANDAAQTSINAIKTKVSLFTTLSNIKKSLSAMVQSLKILATNVGAISGITSDLTATSSNVALSAEAGNNLQSQLEWKTKSISLQALTQTWTYEKIVISEIIGAREIVLITSDGAQTSTIIGGDVHFNNGVPDTTYGWGYLVGSNFTNGEIRVATTYMGSSVSPHIFTKIMYR